MPTELPARTTPLDPRAVASALRAQWMSLLGACPSATSVAIATAQSALETGRWTFCKNYNLGNIKAPPADEIHDYAFFATTEVVPNILATKWVTQAGQIGPCKILETREGNLVKVELLPNHPGCRFRAFTSLDEAALDYVAFLHSRYPAAWSALQQGEPSWFVHALKVHGYFSGDENAYRKSVVSLTKEFTALLPPDPPKVA